jgi:hypothetical protein
MTSASLPLRKRVLFGVPVALLVVLAFEGVAARWFGCSTPGPPTTGKPAPAATTGTA